jgi:hypothetical protein
MSGTHHHSNILLLYCIYIRCSNMNPQKIFPGFCKENSYAKWIYFSVSVLLVRNKHTIALHYPLNVAANLSIWFHYFKWLWTFSRTRQPSGLKHVLSSLVSGSRGSWVLIPHKTWIFVVCMHLFPAYLDLCLGRGLATTWSLVQGILPSVKWSNERQPRHRSV